MYRSLNNTLEIFIQRNARAFTHRNTGQLQLEVGSGSLVTVQTPTENRVDCSIRPES